MPIRSHPLKKLRRMIQGRLQARRTNTAYTSNSLKNFFEKRGSEIVTMST